MNNPGRRGPRPRALATGRAQQVAQAVATGWLGSIGSSVKSWLGSNVPMLTGAPAAQPRQRPPRYDPAPASSENRQEGGGGGGEGEDRDAPGMVVHRGRHLKDMPVSQLRRVLAEDFDLTAPGDALRSELVAQLADAVETAARTAARPASRPASHSSARMQMQVPAGGAANGRYGEDLGAPSSEGRPRLSAPGFTSPSSSKRVRDEEGGDATSYRPPVGSDEDALERPSKRSNFHRGDGMMGNGFTAHAADESTYPANSSSNPTSSLPSAVLAAPAAPPMPPPLERLPQHQLPAPASMHSRQPGRRHQTAMYRRSPYGRSRAVRTPTRAPVPHGWSSSVDPQVSSAIAKRILETLGEVSRPFQDAREQPIPVLTSENPPPKRHRPEGPTQTPTTSSFMATGGQTLRTPDDAAPAFSASSSRQSDGVFSERIQAASSPLRKDDSPALPDDMEFHFAAPTTIESTPRQPLAGVSTKNTPTYVFSPPGKSLQQRSSKPPLTAKKSSKTPKAKLASPHQSGHHVSESKSGASAETGGNYDNYGDDGDDDDGGGGKSLWELFGKMDEGKWKCSSCYARNPNDLIKCAACEAPRDDTTESASASAQPPPSSSSSSSSSVSSFSSFSAGTSASTTSSSSSSAATSAAASPFASSFTSPKAFSGETTETPVPAGSIGAGGFTFGATPQAKSTFGESTSTPALGQSGTASISSKGFTFGTPLPDKADDSARVPVADSNSDAPSASIGFKMPSAKPTGSGAFSTAGSTESALAGPAFGMPKTSEVKSSSESSGAFLFGAPAALESSGISAAVTAAPSKPSAPTTSTFVFGGGTASSSAAPAASEPKQGGGVFSFGAKATTATEKPFAFGSSLTTAASEPPAASASQISSAASDAPTFTFGASNVASSAASKSDSSGLGANAPTTTLPPPAPTTFTFGGSSTSAPASASASAPASVFKFGAPASSDTAGTPQASSASRGTPDPGSRKASPMAMNSPSDNMEYGSNSPSIMPSTGASEGTVFGAAPSVTTSSVGGPSLFGGSTSATPFGAPAASSTGSVFGAQPAATPSFGGGVGGGGGTSVFGSAPAPSAPVGAFMFGGSAPSQAPQAPAANTVGAASGAAAGGFSIGAPRRKVKGKRPAKRV